MKNFNILNFTNQNNISEVANTASEQMSNDSAGLVVDSVNNAISIVKKDGNGAKEIKTLNLNSSGGAKTYEKFVVLAVYGQSNSVGYDESALTLFDTPKYENRLFQVEYNSGSITPLDYCAISAQNMKTEAAAGITPNGMSAKAHAGTKGIHLPLANLIADALPNDYGVIIVPGSFGGRTITQLSKSGEYYSKWINNIKTAVNSNEKNIFLGILWCQGEFDAQNGKSGANYKNEFITLINDTKSDLASIRSKTINGAEIDASFWYVFEYPLEYKNKSTGRAILEAQKEVVGANYVEVPDDTPVNTTKYTSSLMSAHYGQDAFRKIIAPRVFSTMCQNGMFLTNSYDEKGGADTSAVIDTLSRQIANLQTQIELLAQSSGANIATWKTPTSEQMSVWGDGASYENGTISFNSKSAGFLFDESVRKFRYKIPSGAKDKLVFLIVGLDSEFSGAKVACKSVMTIFNSSVQSNYINCTNNFNTQVGANGSSQNDINALFKNDNSESLITIERLEDGRIKATNDSGGEIIFNAPNNNARFGFQGWQGFTTISLSDIEIYG